MVIHGVAIDALVDSGSTHSFSPRSPPRAWSRSQTTAGSHGGRQRVANNERVPTSGVCKAVSVTIGDGSIRPRPVHHPLGRFELVFGCDLLRTLGQILWDLERLSMAFWRHDHCVKWYGVSAKAWS